MEIDSKTAFRLWERDYGRDVRSKDYAGRPMDKAAYGDRNSDYGWNIDHIYPESKGGKSVPNNLICCNIQTNDEKANKFPAFRANGQIFNIVRVQNHYEIVNKSNPDYRPQQSRYDHVYEIERAKTDQPMTLVEALVVIKPMSAVLSKPFLRDIFDGADIKIRQMGEYWTVLIQAQDFVNQHIERLMVDSCTLLRTYLDYYFISAGIISNYNIFVCSGGKPISRIEEYLLHPLSASLLIDRETRYLLDPQRAGVLDSIQGGICLFIAEGKPFVEYGAYYQDLAKDLTNYLKETSGR